MKNFIAILSGGLNEKSFGINIPKTEGNIKRSVSEAKPKINNLRKDIMYQVASIRCVETQETQENGQQNCEYVTLVCVNVYHT